MTRRPPRSTLFPYPTLFRSRSAPRPGRAARRSRPPGRCRRRTRWRSRPWRGAGRPRCSRRAAPPTSRRPGSRPADRKSTRLNSSHSQISYAVFCLKKKNNRPLLVMRSNLWASGYDVDGTDQTSLGQFSGRVQQTYTHSVPRFFVPEHGTMFTLALVRFPPTATKEIQYLNAKGALTFFFNACDPPRYLHFPPPELSPN